MSNDLSQLNGTDLLDIEIDEIDDSPEFITFPTGRYIADVYFKLDDYKVKKDGVETGDIDTRITSMFTLAEIIDIDEEKLEEGETLPKVSDLMSKNYFKARGVQDFVTDFRSVMKQLEITQPKLFLEQVTNQSPIPVSFKCERRFNQKSGFYEVKLKDLDLVTE